MFIGTIVAESDKGYWFAEQDVTHESVFVHHRQVVRGRYLHIGDRIRFSLAPNPSKPDKLWAVDVEFIGIQIARQVGGGVQS